MPEIGRLRDEIADLRRSLDDCLAQLSMARSERDAIREAHEQDVKDAASELLIEIPEPGSDMAKMMIANRLLINRLNDAAAFHGPGAGSRTQLRKVKQALKQTRKVLRKLVNLATSDCYELRFSVAFANLEGPIAKCLNDRFASHLIGRAKMARAAAETERGEQ